MKILALALALIAAAPPLPTRWWTASSPAPSCRASPPSRRPPPRWTRPPPMIVLPRRRSCAPPGTPPSTPGSPPPASASARWSRAGAALPLPSGPTRRIPPAVPCRRCWRGMAPRWPRARPMPKFPSPPAACTRWRRCSTIPPLAATPGQTPAAPSPAPPRPTLPRWRPRSRPTGAPASPRCCRPPAPRQHPLPVAARGAPGDLHPACHPAWLRCRGPSRPPAWQPHPPRPLRAESRASGRSLHNVTLSLAANRALAEALSDGGTEYLFEYFDYAQGVAAKLDDPVFAGVDTPGGRLRVQELKTAIERVHDAASTELAAELGVAAGFNALDGD
ncbi:hypothetical protein AKL17_0557 [Frigidibacter mobilis]|uniref:Imelysin-like domain-containing protein n=1 Tax=Frigidibacter mobilis TaxID=1335048 RepID=A0A159YZI2_9RHOB|nr:hypothetical protein AKL17_0557 [Frigidibacter mobilis]